MTVLILTASFLLVRSLWSADDIATLVFEVEGVGAIERQNLSLAREKAIEDALAQALKAAINSVLRPDLPPTKYQEAGRRISEQKADYIKKYGISAESSDQAVYRVRVNATLYVGAMAEKLRSLGYETVRNENIDKEVALTVRDVRSYEEYTQLQEYLKQGVPCIRRATPVRFSWKEVSFRLTIRGTSGCVTAVQLPFDVQTITDDEITGEIHRSE